MRRKLTTLKGFGIFYMVLILAVILLLPLSSTAQSKQPIKLGYVGPMSGFYSHGGTHTTQGIKMALDEVNWTVGGRKIEFLVEDDGWDIGVGISKTKKLVLNDKVDLMLGPHNGQVILALRDFLIENKMIHVSPMADEATLTRDKYSKYYFRASYDAIADRYHVAGYIAQKKGYRKVAYMGADFIPSRECLKGFREVFEPLGGKIVKEIFVPFGTTDFAPYFTQIDMKNTDALYVFFFGGDAISFVKQYSQYGLKGRLPILGVAICDGAILKAQGDAALGIETVSTYSETLSTPENKKFVAAYEKKYGMDVDFHADLGYVTAKVALMGLDKTKGDTSDLDKLIGAMEKVQFLAPRGPFKYGPNHSPIQNVYLREVRKINGVIQNVAVETVTEVGQGWMPPQLR